MIFRYPRHDHATFAQGQGSHNCITVSNTLTHEIRHVIYRRQIPHVPVYDDIFQISEYFYSCVLSEPALVGFLEKELSINKNEYVWRRKDI